MKKTVFRTFVYSFAISTLVIFSINKLPSYFPHENNQAKKVQKYKNISSFVKDNSKYSVSDIPSGTGDTLENNDLIVADKKIEKNDNDTSLYYNEDSEEDNFSYSDEPDDATIAKSEELSKQNDAFEEIDIVEAFIDTAPLYEEKDSDLVEETTASADRGEEDKPNWKVSELEQLNNPVGGKGVTATTLGEGNNKQEEQKSFIPIQKNPTAKAESISITNNAEPNQVAMSQTGTSLKNMITEDNNTESTEYKDKKNENPWVVAKGSKFPNNNMLVSVSNSEESKAIEKNLNTTPKTSNGEVKVAEMVRNILIPIPEDILKEGNVMPQLISSKRNKELQDRIEQNIKDKKSEEEKPSQSKQEEKTMTPIDNDSSDSDSDGDNKDKKTIFDSISSIFSPKTPDIGISKSTNEQKFDTASSVYSVKRNNKSKKDNKVTKILPTEIKLSFQPNRAEISGQTLKWIEAFANKTIEDGSVALEIRIDGTSSFELQQKRLSLLHNILTNKGVEYKKINTVFTTREPNSFIIRTVRTNDKSVAVDSNPRIKENSNYYQKW